MLVNSKTLCDSAPWLDYSEPDSSQRQSETALHCESYLIELREEALSFHNSFR